MIDPGALGTLVIQLEANRRDERYVATTKARGARTRLPRVATRRRLAIGLRWMASRIEPAPMPAR